MHINKECTDGSRITCIIVCELDFLTSGKLTCTALCWCGTLINNSVNYSVLEFGVQ